MKKSLIFLAVLFPLLLTAQSLEDYRFGNGWYRSEEGVSIAPEEMLTALSAEFGLSEGDGLQLEGTETDDLGMTHYRYVQLHKGYEVEESDLVLHYNGESWVAANGWLAGGLDVNTENTVTEDLALSATLSYVDAEVYAWESAHEEQELKDETGDSAATHYPQGKLLIYNKQSHADSAADYLLVWRFEINTLSPFGHYRVYVDALSGEVLEKQDLIMNCNDKPGTCTTSFNGVQNITVRQRGAPHNDFVLRECGNRNIHSQTFYTINSWSRINQEVKDDDGNYGTTEQRITTAHWAAEKAWDYFKYIHNRNGSNGSGRILKVFDDDFTIDNAKYKHSASSDKIFIGLQLADSSTTMGTLDVVGHEVTHGLTQRTAKLNYQGESGALNESFLDIFGTLVEGEVQSSIDWLVADELTASHLRRSLQDPHLFQQPKVYGGQFWAPTGKGDPDQGGVHINSGVQNHFFYLLCMGGVGVAQNSPTVVGIGKHKAEKIAFRALTVYMGKKSNYADARNAWVSAAIDLFGICSFEFIQVMNAWGAVGVDGTGFQLACIQLLKPSGKQDVSYCSNAQITFTATTNLKSPTYHWSLPPGVSVVSQSGGQITITSLSVPQTTLSVHATNATASTPQVNKYVDTKVCRLRAEGYASGEAGTAVSVYPNPANGKLYVEVGEVCPDLGVEIYDRIGRKAVSLGLHHRKTEVDLSGFAPGIYLVRVVCGNTEYQDKIIITRE